MESEILDLEKPRPRRLCFLSRAISRCLSPWKSEQTLLRNVPESQISGFRRILLTFYLYYAEGLLALLVTASILNQIAFMAQTDEMRVPIDSSGMILTIALFELLIDAMLTLDFTLKVFLRSFFSDPGFYGPLFCLLDFIAGPCALLYDVINAVFSGEFRFEGYMLRTAKVLTLGFCRRMLKRLAAISPRIQPLFWDLFVFFYIFSYFAVPLYYDELPVYFSGISESLFTMFQLLTLDSWGVLGRLVLEEQGVFWAYYMAAFIFLMTYFFLNILLAAVVDNMTPSNPIYIDLVGEGSGGTGGLLAGGGPHDLAVELIFLSSWLGVHTYTQENSLQGNLAVLWELALDGIFAVSFLARIGTEYANKERNYWILGVKSLAGPGALALDLYCYFSGSVALLLGHYLRIFQILTTNTLSSFISGSFPLFPKVTYPFLLLIGLITFLACWTTERLGAAMPEFFNNFNLSLYSFIQMLSLDEWCNTVTRGILSNALESALIFIVFIVVSNYILLSLMLAIACSELKKPSFESEAPVQQLNPRQVLKHSLGKVLTNLLSLIAFQHKLLFKLLENNEAFKKALNSKHSTLETYEEVEQYFELRKRLADPEKRKGLVAVEFKGRVLASSEKTALFLEVNRNCELVGSEEEVGLRNLLKTESEVSLSERSFFEVELPPKYQGKAAFWARMLSWYRLWTRRSEPKADESPTREFHSF